MAPSPLGALLAASLASALAAGGLPTLDSLASTVQRLRTCNPQGAMVNREMMVADRKR